MSLFPPRFNGAPASASSGTVEINAGRCDMVLQSNGKYRVAPTPARGTIQLIVGDGGAYSTLKWKNRQTNATEGDDVVLMPRTAEMKMVNTGRVGGEW